MSVIPLAEFRVASDLFQEQVRGEFGSRITADILAPMGHELETLSADNLDTLEQIAELECQLNEQD